LCGVVDVGHIDLNAARNGPLPSNEDLLRRRRHRHHDPGASEVVNKLTQSLQPEVVAKLDDLERHGMLPARLQFVRLMARIFGSEILHSTALPWIPLGEPPGNVIHRSTRVALDRIRKSERVICGVGLTIADAYAVSHKRKAFDMTCPITVVAIGFEEFQVEYSVKNELEREQNGSPALIGPLAEVLSRAEIDRKELVLLDAILVVISRAWHLEIEELLSGALWHLDLDRNSLWTPLSRPGALGSAHLS
jgi:hypothetical protein